MVLVRGQLLPYIIDDEFQNKIRVQKPRFYSNYSFYHILDYNLHSKSARQIRISTLFSNFNSIITTQHTERNPIFKKWQPIGGWAFKFYIQFYSLKLFFSQWRVFTNFNPLIRCLQRHVSLSNYSIYKYTLKKFCCCRICEFH